MFLALNFISKVKRLMENSTDGFIKIEPLREKLQEYVWMYEIIHVNHLQYEYFYVFH